jgi:hypothetical protein
MRTIEEETLRRENLLIAAVTDAAGDLRPITKISFEVIGNQVRWSIFEGEQLLHALTNRLSKAMGFLEPTKDLLEMIVEDRCGTKSFPGA